MATESRSIRIIRTVIETLRPQFNIELWDGTRIGAFDGPSLVINDPTIVRQLMLRPNYDSLIDIWTSGRVDIRNGTIFDLANARLDGSLKQRLKELPKWRYENGWIRRKYKTHGWKSTLMVINTVGHLAEAAWHHPDIAASYAWVEVKLTNHAAKGVTDKDFQLARKIEEVVGWQPGKEGGALTGTPQMDQRFAYIKYD